MQLSLENQPQMPATKHKLHCISRSALDAVQLVLNQYTFNGKAVTMFEVESATLLQQWTCLRFVKRVSNSMMVP